MNKFYIDELNYPVDHGFVVLEKTEISAPKNIALIGNNGVGKTRFLQKLSGLIDNHIHFYSIANETIMRLPKQEIAVLFTDCRFMDFMTVERFVSLGRSFQSNSYGDLNFKDKSIIEKYLEFFQLFDLRFSQMGHLSDGQRQRVQLARVFAQEANIVLLDEPSSYLDFDSKFEIMNKVQDLSKKNKQIILTSTHDFHLNMNSYDFVWHIENGKINQYSTDEFKSTIEYKKLNLT